jgi:hypothetical protein
MLSEYMPGFTIEYVPILKNNPQDMSKEERKELVSADEEIADLMKELKIVLDQR